MSKPDDEFKARQNPFLREQMDRQQFQLFPAWSEDEYILASQLWKIFKHEPGTSGKKRAINEIRNYKEDYAAKAKQIIDSFRLYIHDEFGENSISDSMINDFLKHISRGGGN